MKRTSARTCVIATLGPASDSPERIAELIDAGTNVFRLNFSHGDRDSHAGRFEAIRKASAERLKPVGILQDLQGPKIRIGRFDDGSVHLEPGATFILDCDQSEPGNAESVGVSYRGLSQDVSRGEELLLDDGRLALEIVEIAGRKIKTRVTRGGKLGSNKGINLPGSDLRIPALSDKDVEDIKLGAELGVDWVAMSFVRSRDDVFLARHYLERFGSDARLMAKIEKPSAIARFDDILDAADGIMIARGDLGVELSPEQVPIVQKRLIRACREAGKPVVTATQMLESMTGSPIPTRAEASDVANAIFDGSDAVMLSAETAVGEYPVAAVEFMNRLALAVESDEAYQRAMQEKVVQSDQTIADSVAHAACQMAQEIGAEVIVTFSSSGSTALRVARHRVANAVLAITPSELAYRQLAMSWGISAVLAPRDISNSDEMVSEANAWILKSKLGEPGDNYVITAGVPFGVAGTTNLIRAETVQAI
ncbi:MAG: pyruvate kinase [Xanthomonadales bacterium]|nr:pyruvate kinase [Xanthomonadales bacterium]